jgi:hypothetical protein
LDKNAADNPSGDAETGGEDVLAVVVGGTLSFFRVACSPPSRLNENGRDGLGTKEGPVSTAKRVKIAIQSIGKIQKTPTDNGTELVLIRSLSFCFDLSIFDFFTGARIQI